MEGQKSTYQWMTLDVGVGGNVFLQVSQLPPQRHHTKSTIKDNDTQEFLDVNVAKLGPDIYLADGTLKGINMLSLGKDERQRWKLPS